MNGRKIMGPDTRMYKEKKKEKDGLINFFSLGCGGLLEVEGLVN